MTDIQTYSETHFGGKTDKCSQRQEGKKKEKRQTDIFRDRFTQIQTDRLIQTF